MGIRKIESPIVSIVSRCKLHAVPQRSDLGNIHLHVSSRLQPTGWLHVAPDACFQHMLVIILITREYISWSLLTSRCTGHNDTPFL